jgi:UDP-N-acetylmuramate--alanine ligase
VKGSGTDIGTIHFVGIGGIGMSGIAEVMHISATPCRDPTSPKAMSSRACASSASRSRSAMTAANLGDAAVVVTSTAIRKDNPEVVRAYERPHPGRCAAPRCSPS